MVQVQYCTRRMYNILILSSVRSIWGQLSPDTCSSRIEWNMKMRNKWMAIIPVIFDTLSDVRVQTFACQFLIVEFVQVRPKYGCNRESHRICLDMGDVGNHNSYIPTVMLLRVSKLYISSKLSRSDASPNVKYTNGRLVTQQTMSCSNNLIDLSPLNAPQPQFPVATAGANVTRSW